MRRCAFSDTYSALPSPDTVYDLLKCLLLQTPISSDSISYWAEMTPPTVELHTNCCINAGVPPKLERNSCSIIGR